MNKIYQHTNNTYRPSLAQGSTGAEASSNLVGPQNNTATPGTSQQDNGLNNTNNHAHHQQQRRLQQNLQYQHQYQQQSSQHHQQQLGNRFNVDEWLKSINAWDEKYDFVMHNNHWLTSNWDPDCEKCNLHDEDLINLNETFDLYKSALEESPAPHREIDLMASSRIPRIPVRSLKN